MSDAFLPDFPAFANELAGTLAVHAQYVLHGNIRDKFLLRPPEVAARPTAMLPLLWQALKPSGYECFICYDPVDGISVFPEEEPGARRAAEALLGSRAIGRRPSLERLRNHLARVIGVPEQPPIDGEAAVQQSPNASPQTPQTPLTKPAATMPKARAAFIIDYAARITRVPGQLDPAERDFFLYCQKLALTAKPVPGSGARPNPLYNPLIWLVEGERDLPAWLTAGVEPIRTVAVGMPTLDERFALAEVLAPALPVPGNPVATWRADAVQTFAKRTDSMTLQAMMEITKLARDRNIAADRIADVIRIYKLGVDDNPWRRGSVKQQIVKGEKDVVTKVLGQDLAVKKTLDILKRAALGLSGAQATSTVSRPRGVLFFAGPTGVGKTELAKQVAAILFGDANAYLRFDMSEFAADHSADRLIGAPPGYVGFEAGGELTGAVRRKPFQVVLFDEIEKAHPRILDKFLQILEDGRLTDGQGITTYFSECVLIFTSNLGISVTDPKTGERRQIVEPGMEYPVLERQVKTAIRAHFTDTIGRPELLNRLGDNIVVFNFITSAVAGDIARGQLDNITAKVRDELGVDVELSERAVADLLAACTEDLANGGRGIGNVLESNLINPLARLLFEGDCGDGDSVVVRSVRVGTAEAGPELTADVYRGRAA